MDKGQVINRVRQYNQEYALARISVVERGLNLANAQTDLVLEKAATLRGGKEAGALDGKNAEARKQAETTWLAESPAYQTCLKFVAASEADLATAACDLDIAKMGIRVCECLAKLLED